MKCKLTSPPILSYPDFRKEFALFTDASDKAIGCVLSQYSENGEVVVAYGSRTLSKAEKNYSTVEKECLAVVHFTQEYRHYLLGRKFKIVSDHRPLVWLKNLKNPTGRLGRWALKLSEFDYDVVYRKGRLNSNADFLSRIDGEEVNQTKVENPSRPMLTVSQIKTAQNKDELCRAMIRYLRHQEIPSNSEKMEKKVICEGPRYMLRGDGVLLYQIRGTGGVKKGNLEGGDPAVVLPRSLRDAAFGLLHDHMTAGHLGFKKTLERFQGRFYWEGMYADIKTYTRECMSCNKAKTPPIRRCAPLASYTRPKGPLDKVQVDIIGKIYPQSYSGMSVILVITDEFTKFAEAIALPDQKAQTVAQALVTQFFCKYGIPNTIHTDQGKNFMSGLLKEITQLLGIEKVIGTAYHPQSQGAVERCNRSLKEMLMHYVQEDPRQWDRFIPFVMQAYNTSPSATTLFTPYFLFFGREAKLPVDVLIDKPDPQYRGADDYKAEVAEKMYLAHKLASKNAEEARELQKRQYDKKAKIRHFAVGDQVYLTNEAVRSRRLKEGFSRKFAYPWKGPYRIVQQMSEVNFKIKEIGGSKCEVVHMNRLKLVPAGNLAPEEERMASKARKNETNGLKEKGDMGESKTQNEDSDDELFEESRGEISVRDESDQDEDETNNDQVSDDLDEEEAEEDMMTGVDEEGTSVGRPFDEKSEVVRGDEVSDTENGETLQDEEE